MKEKIFKFEVNKSFFVLLTRKNYYHFVNITQNQSQSLRLDYQIIQTIQINNEIFLNIDKEYKMNIFSFKADRSLQLQIFELMSFNLEIKKTQKPIKFKLINDILHVSQGSQLTLVKINPNPWNCSKNIFQISDQQELKLSLRDFDILDFHMIEPQTSNDLNKKMKNNQKENQKKQYIFLIKNTQTLKMINFNIDFNDQKSMTYNQMANIDLYESNISQFYFIDDHLVIPSSKQFLIIDLKTNKQYFLNQDNIYPEIMQYKAQKLYFRYKNEKLFTLKNKNSQLYQHQVLSLQIQQIKRILEIDSKTFIIQDFQNKLYKQTENGFDIILNKDQLFLRSTHLFVDNQNMHTKIICSNINKYCVDVKTFQFKQKLDILQSQTFSSPIFNSILKDSIKFRISQDSFIFSSQKYLQSFIFSINNKNEVSLTSKFDSFLNLDDPTLFFDQITDNFSKQQFKIQILPRQINIQTEKKIINITIQQLLGLEIEITSGIFTNQTLVIAIQDQIHFINFKNLFEGDTKIINHRIHLSEEQVKHLFVINDFSLLGFQNFNSQLLHILNHYEQNIFLKSSFPLGIVKKQITKAFIFNYDNYFMHIFQTNSKNMMFITHNEMLEKDNFLTLHQVRDIYFDQMENSEMFDISHEKADHFRFLVCQQDNYHFMNIKKNIFQQSFSPSFQKLDYALEITPTFVFSTDKQNASDIISFSCTAQDQIHLNQSSFNNKINNQVLQQRYFLDGNFEKMYHFDNYLILISNKNQIVLTDQELKIQSTLSLDQKIFFCFHKRDELFVLCDKKIMIFSLKPTIKLIMEQQIEMTLYFLEHVQFNYYIGYDENRIFYLKYDVKSKSFEILQHQSFQNKIPDTYVHHLSQEDLENLIGSKLQIKVNFFIQSCIFLKKSRLSLEFVIQLGYSILAWVEYSYKNNTFQVLLQKTHNQTLSKICQGNQEERQIFIVQNTGDIVTLQFNKIKNQNGFSYVMEEQGVYTTDNEIIDIQNLNFLSQELESQKQNQFQHGFLLKDGRLLLFQLAESLNINYIQQI